MPKLDASHSISKDFENFGKSRMDAFVNFSYNVLKVFSCSLSHVNSTFFITMSFNGDAMVLKSLTNLL